MSRKIWLLAVLLAAIALATAPAQEKPAETPVQQSAAKPTEQSPGSRDFSKEAYVIERYSTRLNAEADGTGTREMTAGIKILADAGVKAFAVLNFTYTSANQTVEIDYVRVRKPDGTVVKTPDYNVQDMPGEVTRTAPLYSDIHEKHVAVKGLGVGDVLEYLVRFRTFKAEVPGQFWYEYSFAKDFVAKDERLELSVPADKYVKVVSPEFEPEMTQEGNRRVYRWVHQNLQVKEKDPNEVPRRVPPNPDVQITTFASWEDVGRWYGGLQKESVAVTPAIQTKANELTKGLSTDDEKIHAIYNFVALKFHYIGLDFGIGRYQPHAADDVLDNGYGDCKDKHTLLATLLKAAGIEAWPVLIHASRKLDPNVPSPAQFNHVITVIPSGSQYIWLDTTPEVAPYGLLLLLLRDKQALVIPTSKPALLMMTPANPPFPSEQEFSMEGKLDATGTFTGHAEQSYRGDMEVVLRLAFRQLAESQWKEFMQRFSYGLNFMGDVSNVKITPPDDIDKTFEISYDYVRKKFGDWENHHTQAPLPPMGLEAYEGVKEKKPPEPVLLGAVGKIVYHGRMELPEGYKAEIPAPLHLSETYAEYDDTPKIENGVLTVTRELTIKKTEIPLSDWEGYRRFGLSLAGDEFKQITLEPSHVLEARKKEPATDAEDAKNSSDSGTGETSDTADLDSVLQEGTDAIALKDYRRAQELFEKVIVKDPNYPGAHLKLATVLLLQNDFADGLEELRKEEKASPKDWRAYQAAAFYLIRMERYDDAEAEYRKLLQVDPTSCVASVPVGQRLYEAGKYTEDIAILEPVVKSGTLCEGARGQLRYAYAKNGQREQAIAAWREAVGEKADDPEILNEGAYSLAENKIDLDLSQQWAEKAVKKTEEQSQKAVNLSDAALHATYLFSMVWDTLGWIYFEQGDLERAEGMVRASWLLFEESDVAEHLGEIYEKEGKKEQAAQAYEYALKLDRVETSGAPPPDKVKAFQKRQNENRARYKTLTGHDPAPEEVRRLPNGEWTQTVAEKLRNLREATLANAKKLSGTGQFIVTFKPDKTRMAHQLSGDESLKALTDEIAAAHYTIEFPPESEAILALKVDVRCTAKSPCTAKLVDPSAQ